MKQYVKPLNKVDYKNVCKQQSAKKTNAQITKLINVVEKWAIYVKSKKSSCVKQKNRITENFIHIKFVQ